jgi:hypothetical protein
LCFWTRYFVFVTNMLFPLRDSAFCLATCFLGSWTWEDVLKWRLKKKECGHSGSHL